MVAENNGIGAIPLVITLSQAINNAKVPTPGALLRNWYAQIAGNSSAGSQPFNISNDNWVLNAPGPLTGARRITAESNQTYKLSRAAWNGRGTLKPHLTLSRTNKDFREYDTAYNKAAGNLNRVLSAGNPDIRVGLNPRFPVFWLGGMQSGVILLTSGNPKLLGGKSPSSGLVNSQQGAPNPTQSSINYILSEGYFGKSVPTDGGQPTDSNNGDATYIEQFSLPNSLILWYSDSQGNLYRGVNDDKGNNLSIPGIGAFVKDGQYNPNYNNGYDLAKAITDNFEKTSKVFANREHGTLYANPKDTFSTESNAVFDPDFGNYYQYQYSLGQTPPATPITWIGNNSGTYYQVNSISFNGFDNADASSGGNPLNAFDSNAYAELNVSYGSSADALTSTANIVVPWLGYNPGSPSQPNNYSIVAPGTKDSGLGPSGGWSVSWNPNDNTVWMGSNTDTSTNLNALSGTTPVTPSGGLYGATNLFKYYDQLFQYNAAKSTFIGQSFNYTQNKQGLFTATGDTITAYPGFAGTASGVNGTGQWMTADGTTYSVTVNSGTPDASTSGPLNLGGQAGPTLLQIQYVGGSNPWQVMVPTSQGWTSQWQGQVQQNSTFSVANGGLLPGTSPVSLTVTVTSPPSQSISPAPLAWTNFTASNGAVLEAMVDANGNWLLQGNPTNAWNGSGSGTAFPAPGVLANGFQPTFTLAQAPDATSSSSEVGLIFSAGGTNFTAQQPITAFTASDGKGNTIATLTPNSIWKANQLAQSGNFTYAANEAGIAGANAGSYTLDAVTGAVVNTYQNIGNSWDSGGVVGDYLSLLNAGLLGATQSFDYKGTKLPIGQLYTLQQPGEVSPWFDKLHGPVVNGYFGQTAWTADQKDLKYWNTWSSLLNQYAPNVYTFGLSDRFGNKYDIDLNLEKKTISKNDTRSTYLKFNPNAQANDPASAFTVVKAQDIVTSLGGNSANLYPLMAEYQIGGFGASTDPSSPFDFLPSYAAVL